MKRLLASVLCALGLAPKPAESQVTAEDYTHEVAAALREAFPNCDVVVKQALQIEIADPIGTRTVAWLDNSYSEYLLAPEEKSQRIAEFVAAQPDISVLAQRIDTTKLLPLIKSRQWLKESTEAISRALDTDHVDLAFETYNDELVIQYAHDNPHNYATVTRSQIAGAGVDLKRLRMLAIQNLRRILVPRIEYHRGDFVTMITVGGDLESSLLLLDEIWTETPVQVEGEVLIAVPNRDILLFTGTKSPNGAAALRKHARDSFIRSSYPISDVLFVYRNGHFVRFEE